MLLLCGRKPPCSLRGIECFPVPLGRRVTKFQGPDLLAHLEWFSCTSRNLSEVLGEGKLNTVLKGWQQGKPCFWRPGGGHLCSQGKDWVYWVYWSCFLPRASTSRVLPDPPLVRTPASWAVWVSLILFRCVFLEGCISIVTPILHSVHRMGSLWRNQSRKALYDGSK